MMKTELLPVDDSLWIAKGDYSLLGAQLGTTMTIIGLENDSLFVHSPIPPSEYLINHLKDLGEPQYFVAPSMMHNLNLDAWQRHFPAAQYFHASGAKTRCDVSQPLQTHAEFPWRDEIESINIEGMPKVNEWVFFQKKTGTLVVCDLTFNIREPMDRWTRLMFKLYGVHDQCRMTPLFQMMVKDRKAFSRSINEIKLLEIKRIIHGHGAILTKHPMSVIESMVEDDTVSLA